MSGFKVVYDGWDLIYSPNSPAALHLLTLLETPLTDWTSILAVPGETFHKIPDHVILELVKTPNSSTARLSWEQRLLPKLARKLNADLVHWLDGGPALFSVKRNVVSPTEQRLWDVRLSRPHTRQRFIHHLRDALAQGGLARASALLWPADLPEPELSVTMLQLPPLSPGYDVDKFQMQSSLAESQSLKLDLPETYILYHGPVDRHSLVDLMGSWSWAAGAIGGYYPMLILGVNDTEREELELWINERGFQETVHLLPPLPRSMLTYLYDHSSAVFHPVQSSPWGGPLRLALSRAKPIVALETPLADAIVGSAAYLVPTKEDGQVDTRAMGAALITVIVEESVARNLSQAARERSAKWDKHGFHHALQQAYLNAVRS